MNQEEHKFLLSAEELDKCEKHPCYPKDLLCLTTKKSLCRVCQEENEHIKHEHVDILKTYGAITARINNTFEDVEKMIEEQELCHKNIVERCEKFYDEINETKSRIGQYYNKLRDLIDKVEEENMYKLEKTKEDFKKSMKDLLENLKNFQEQSETLKDEMNTLKTDWEIGDKKPKKSGLIENYFVLDDKFNDLKKQTKKLIHETAWTLKIETTPNLDGEEKDWDFSEFGALKIKIHDFTLYCGDFVDKNNIQLAEEDEKRKIIMAKRVNTFNSYCIHDEERYPTTTYCDKCNKLFCSICKEGHKCDKILVINNVIKDDKKKKHTSLIEFVEIMEKSLEDLKKENNKKRDEVKGELVKKLNEIAIYFKNERMELLKREEEVTNKLKDTFFDEQKNIDKLSMSVCMWKDALDYFLEKCKSIDFVWNLEVDNKGAIYKPVRQLIQESRNLCDQESYLKEQVDMLNKECGYELAFSFKGDTIRFEEARKAVSASVSKNMYAPKQQQKAPVNIPAPIPALKQQQAPVPKQQSVPAVYQQQQQQAIQNLAPVPKQQPAPALKQQPAPAPAPAPKQQHVHLIHNHNYQPVPRQQVYIRPVPEQQQQQQVQQEQPYPQPMNYGRFQHNN